MYYSSISISWTFVSQDLCWSHLQQTPIKDCNLHFNLDVLWNLLMFSVNLKTTNKQKKMFIKANKATES